MATTSNIGPRPGPVLEPIGDRFIVENLPLRIDDSRFFVASANDGSKVKVLPPEDGDRAMRCPAHRGATGTPCGDYSKKNSRA